MRIVRHPPPPEIITWYQPWVLSTFFTFQSFIIWSLSPVASHVLVFFFLMHTLATHKFLPTVRCQRPPANCSPVVSSYHTHPSLPLQLGKVTTFSPMECQQEWHGPLQDQPLGMTMSVPPQCPDNAEAKCGKFQNYSLYGSVKDMGKEAVVLI